jgi:hypothetical protein
VDWKKGKPVRVVRNYKLHKHSKYAPEVGNRYEYFMFKVILINKYNWYARKICIQTSKVLNIMLINNSKTINFLLYKFD